MFDVKHTHGNTNRLTLKRSYCSLSRGKRIFCKVIQQVKDTSEFLRISWYLFIHTTSTCICRNCGSDPVAEWVLQLWTCTYFDVLPYVQYVHKSFAYISYSILFHSASFYLGAVTKTRSNMLAKSAEAIRNGKLSIDNQEMQSETFLPERSQPLQRRISNDGRGRKTSHLLQDSMFSCWMGLPKRSIKDQ